MDIERPWLGFSAYHVVVERSENGLERSRLSILSIGHSNTSFSVFASRLREADRQVVVDVRSVPYSSYARHFSRDLIGPLLRDAGFGYLYLGDVLGAGHNILNEPEHERARRIERGIDRVERGALEFRLVLMCGEVRPEGCHRRHLLGNELARRNYDLGHVLGDGEVVMQSELASAESAQLNQLRLDLD